MLALPIIRATCETDKAQPEIAVYEDEFTTAAGPYTISKVSYAANMSALFTFQSLTANTFTVNKFYSLNHTLKWSKSYCNSKFKSIFILNIKQKFCQSIQRIYLYENELLITSMMFHYYLNVSFKIKNTNNIFYIAHLRYSINSTASQYGITWDEANLYAIEDNTVSDEISIILMKPEEGNITGVYQLPGISEISKSDSSPPFIYFDARNGTDGNRIL